MPGVRRPLACFMLSALALVLFQGSAFSQAVSGTLAKSASETNHNITLTPAANVTGFAANTSGTVKFKVVSLNNASQDRLTYEAAQTHTVTTDGNGNVTVPGNAITNTMDFFLADEGLPLLGTTSWANALTAYNARAFKVYVTVEIGGVTKKVESLAAVVIP